jgi:hypothetical protein
VSLLERRAVGDRPAPRLTAHHLEDRVHHPRPWPAGRVHGGARSPASTASTRASAIPAEIELLPPLSRVLIAHHKPSYEHGYGLERELQAVA